MKILRTELASLITITPAPSTAPVVDKETSSTSAGIIPILKRVTPSLWEKVDKKQLTRVEQRGRLLDLFQWLAKKNDWAVLLNAPQRYPSKGRLVAGRTHLQLSKGSESARIEIVFEVNADTFHKLHAAHQAGHRCLAVLVTAHSSEVVLESIARCFPEPKPWLTLIHLPQ